MITMRDFGHLYLSTADENNREPEDYVTAWDMLTAEDRQPLNIRDGMCRGMLN